MATSAPSPSKSSGAQELATAPRSTESVPEGGDAQFAPLDGLDEQGTPLNHGASPDLNAVWVPQPPPSDLSPKDRAWLADARGKKLLDQSTIVMAVAKHDEEGNPRVLQCYPLRQADHALRTGVAPGGGSRRKWERGTATPWPNLFWLVSPTDQQRVGRLEHQGFVRQFRERLLSEPETLSTFERQHSEFARLRWASLSDADRVYAEAARFTTTLRDAGIGGVAYVPQVKCLHAHYAHYLATNGSNIVGAWVADALEAGADRDSKSERFKIM